MGLRFRKSIKLGPARINLSKSGIGWSIGFKGARYTKKANGGHRATIGIPGTGVSYTKDYAFKSNQNCVDRSSPKENIVFQHVSAERRAKEQKFGIAIGVFFALIVIAVLLWKLYGSLNVFQYNAVCTSSVPKEAVWEVGSEIKFVKYPGNCRPGDVVLLEIDAQPETYYSIVAQTDTGMTDSNSLIGTTTNATGKANWSWTIPEKTSPGIYYIQVSDRAGNKNCIDYNIVDSDGSVVGNPPSRNVEELNGKSELTIIIEDSYLYGEQNQIVYVTQTGSKYHKSTCSHVSAGATAMDIDSALASGYAPCQSCY